MVAVGVFPAGGAGARRGARLRQRRRGSLELQVQHVTPKRQDAAGQGGSALPGRVVARVAVKPAAADGVPPISSLLVWPSTALGSAGRPIMLPAGASPRRRTRSQPDSGPSP